MTVTFHALWMLCALGALVWAAAVTHVRDRVALAAGFAAAALLTSGSALPDAVQVGALAAGASAAYLFKPGLRPLGFLIGGGLAGVWTALIEVQAVPAPLALVAVGVLLVITMRVAAARPAFAPDVLREDGMLAVLLVGLGVATLPGVLDGWHAATNLSGTAERAAAVAAIPTWTLALLLASMLLGGAASLWSRR